VLGEPTLVARDDRRDPQGETLLSKQGVPAIAGTVGPDLACLRKVRDEDVVGVARPCDIFLPGLERCADGVMACDELAIRAKDVKGPRYPCVS